MGNDNVTFGLIGGSHARAPQDFGEWECRRSIVEECGALLWGQDWWDGWTDDGTTKEVDCDECGASWTIELEYQEPLVVGRDPAL